MILLRNQHNGEHRKWRWGKITDMDQRPFPKPPPADPLPLDTWLGRVDRAEAGREAFFRGRNAEYEVFRSALTSFSEGAVGGGTMVFHGAPGAGKSALMQECMAAVRLHSTPEAPWVAVAIKSRALQSSIDVVATMVDAVQSESERLRAVSSGITATQTFDNLLHIGKKLYQELSEYGGEASGLSVDRYRSGHFTVEYVFRYAMPLLSKFHIVVCVDEAQNIPTAETTCGVIDILHHPSHGIPLLAAFFGLSNTQGVLRRCGIERLASGRVVDLESLPNHDAVGVIQSVFDAYQFTGSPADRTRWVESLAELSQGWPQHINQVCVAAVRVIREHGGQINGELLEQALERGKESKDRYYAARLAAGSNRAGVYKELALAAEERGGALSYDLIDSLTEGARNKLGETPAEFLTNALHAGLLAPAGGIPDHYRIPIPSFGDYLKALPVTPT